MKNIPICVLFIFFKIFLAYSQENNQLIKRTILLLPFYNIQKNEEYDYLSTVIRNTLYTELKGKSKFNFIDFTLIDRKMPHLLFYKEKIVNENKILSEALKLKSDVVIFGMFDVINEEIDIKTYTIDILTREKVIELNIKGSTGIDVLRIVDDIAYKISSDLTEKLSSIRKSYYEKKMKEQEEKLKKEIAREERRERLRNKQQNKKLDLRGKILVLNSAVDGIDKATIEKVTELFVESIIDKDKCEIINNSDFVDILDKINLRDFERVKKKRIVELGNRVNVDYVIIGNIGKNKKIIKKENELIIKTIIIDVKNEKEIHIGNEDIYGSDLENEIIDLFKESKEKVDQVTFFNRGAEMSIGGGFSPFTFKGFYHNPLNIDTQEIDESKVAILNFQWGVFPNLSLSYYYSPYASIGFNTKIGYAPSFIPYWVGSEIVNTIYTHAFFYNLSIKQKIGSLSSRLKFLLEYGGMLNIIIPSNNVKTFYAEFGNYITIGDFMIDGGLTFLLGFEINYKRFSFELGLLNAFTYGGNSFQNFQLDSRSRSIGYIFNGLELRFNYKPIQSYYYKNIKLPKREEIKIDEQNEEDKYWKRHFFNLCFTSGVSFRYSNFINRFDRRMITEGTGVILGGSIGYLYAFNNLFAFGPGLIAFGDVMYIHQLEEEADPEAGGYSEKYFFRSLNSGLCFMLQFMFGNLRNNKVAFLFDFGGGWFFAAKVGLYIKGFTFKVGYHLPMLFVPNEPINGINNAHNLTFDLGYTINWARKIKIKSAK